MKIKSSRNGEIILSITDIGKSSLVAIFCAARMSFNAIRENKILAKISGFTVFETNGTQFARRIGTSLVYDDNCL